MDKVLGIELKNIGRCDISHTLYDGKISESPFFVESTAVNIQIDQKTGVSFGILSGLRLQESNHMLLQLLIGSPQSQPQTYVCVRLNVHNKGYSFQTTRRG
ncbi:Hypothetical_protein [Hexamita inflata]|uniref:Hypothetical_protein n=1 Tax=Hexamita inflata TaxID=28002 RepID=A0AA86TSS5_9EUKA|nr:Hypothetical protein HINF_LOCUS8673 [Hexamita inflata]